MNLSPYFVQQEWPMVAEKLCRKNIIIVAMLIALSACSSTSDKKKKQADLYFGAGTQSLITKDYTDALTNLTKANELDPENAGILTNLGMAYYFKGERDLAIKTLLRSIKVDENNSDAKVNLASIYFNDGDIPRAEKMYKLVLKDLTYDKQARTFYNLGLIEIRKKNTSAAENYFNRSVQEDSSYCPSLFEIGIIQYDKRLYSKSYQSFKEATMGTCFESPAPHYHQALSLIGLRRYNEARVKLDEVDARFGKSDFASLARRKMMELNQIEQSQMTEDTHASRKMIESPDF